MLNHTKPVKRVETRKLKVIEAVKDDNGDVIDIKEVTIEKKIAEEEVYILKA